jgi:hypothetical protein
MPNSNQTFTNIDDNALDQIVREILHVTPRIGYRLVQGALCRRGKNIQRRRALDSLRRVDPVDNLESIEEYYTTTLFCSMSKCIMVSMNY